MMQSLTTRDRGKWLDVIKKVPSADCYAHPELGKMWEASYPYSFEAVYAEFGDKVIFYPFLVRPLIELPFGKKIMEELGPCFDITSPEYGGIFHNFEDGVPYDIVKQFNEEFGEFCKRRRIVTEFGRVQVLLSNTNLGPGYNVRRMGKVVWVDLIKTPEELEAGMTKEGRKKMRKAVRDGVSVREMGPEGFEQFPPLYYQTMEYHTAAERYYFPKSFFEAMERMDEKFCFILGAYFEEKLVASIIIIQHGGVAYSYLSATNRDYQELRPNNLLFFDMLLKCKERGCHSFVLGGGAGGEDGTYLFKLNFSQLEKDFFIYDRLHIPDLYLKLIELKTEYEHNCSHEDFDPQSVSFFPIYRAEWRPGENH
ncbi:MAG: GNAT family N-acetyltransferase [Caldisericales bacterium]|jgi:hypothetical protein|nr:GNAT family N-acetyltransferase [Caldisericia bacterium]MCE5176329.1 GNAT family N-acetyltransferase [bacterium]NMD13973.1 GNAT family N-acetyltransferase [Caldisericales bacterium]